MTYPIHIPTPAGVITVHNVVAAGSMHAYSAMTNDTDEEGLLMTCVYADGRTDDDACNECYREFWL